MYTQCPHCQTLFRISTDQLKAAAGKAHCCLCDQVFSALDHLREPERDPDWPESRFIGDLPEQQNLELPFDELENDSTQQELHSGLTDLLKALQINQEEIPAEEPETDEYEQLAIDDDRDPFEPAFELNDSQMDSVQIGLDSRFCGPMPPLPPQEDEEQEITPGSIDADTEPGGDNPIITETESETTLPFAIPDNLPELQPTNTQPLSVDETLENTDPTSKGTLTWSLIILTLLLIAAGQLAWFGRDHLLQYPVGRNLLEQACSFIPCQLPPRRNPEKIEVVARSISSHPDFDDALLVMLTIRNQAAFEQPYPTLQLSLLDSTGALIARRSFSPLEYRGSSAGIIQPGVPESFKLELQDPGNEVVGFQFDFY